jgi:hypothetical protein
VKCRFCSSAIDASAAAHAVQMQSKINRACHSASQIRNLAAALWVAFGVRFLPLFGIVGSIMLALCFFAIPIWGTVWAIRYLGIQTEDVYFKRAKKNFYIAMGLWALFMVIWVILFIFAIGWAIYSTQ